MISFLDASQEVTLPRKEVPCSDTRHKNRVSEALVRHNSCHFRPTPLSLPAYTAWRRTHSSRSRGGYVLDQGSNLVEVKQHLCVLQIVPGAAYSSYRTIGRQSGPQSLPEAARLHCRPYTPKCQGTAQRVKCWGQTPRPLGRRLGSTGLPEAPHGLLRL